MADATEVVKLVARQVLSGKEKPWNVELTNVTASISVVRNFDAAATLTLAIVDPDGELINSGFFDAADDGTMDSIDLKIEGRWFRISHLDFTVDGSQANLTLVLEDRNIWYLRQHVGYKESPRGSTTRAEFIRGLVKEVKASGGIEFFSPQLHKPQPIAKSGSVKQAHRPKGGTKAIPRSARLHGKGSSYLTSGQVANANRVLSEAVKQGAGPKATKALVEACIIEGPNFANPTGGDSTSVGILQLLSGHLNGSTSTNGGRRDIELVCKLFLTKGFTGQGGAIKLAKDHPGWSAGQVAQAVQGSGYPDRYDKVSKQADAIIEAFGGISETQDQTVEKKYVFSRGKHENSWEAIRRLADEVGWRAFMRDDTFWYVTDDDLLNYTSAAVVTPGQDASVVSFNWSWDLRKTVQEASISLYCKPWEFEPGNLIKIEGQGPASRRWIISEISRDWANEYSDFTLIVPTHALAEPAPETETVSGSDSSSSGTGSLRDKIIAEAKKTLSSKTHFNYYLAGGNQSKLTDPTPPRGYRSDCSQWVYAIYRKAGAPSPGLTTVQQLAKGKKTSNPKPGDLVLDPRGTHHVELYVGNGKTIGHGSAPIDGWTVDAMRSYFGGVTFVTFDFLDN